jgi:hypothetical protein
MRVKDKKRPFATRCKKGTGKNGLICDDCLKDAMKGSIYVLMHKDVTRQFGIPFKNQVCVEITLNKNIKKPDNKNVNIQKERDTKVKLLESFNSMDMKKLKQFHDILNMDVWVKFSTFNNEYAFRYHLTRELINKLIS